MCVCVIIPKWRLLNGEWGEPNECLMDVVTLCVIVLRCRQVMTRKCVFEVASRSIELYQV